MSYNVENLSMRLHKSSYSTLPVTHKASTKKQFCSQRAMVIHKVTCTIMKGDVRTMVHVSMHGMMVADAKTSRYASSVAVS